MTFLCVRYFKIPSILKYTLNYLTDMQCYHNQAVASLWKTILETIHKNSNRYHELVECFDFSNIYLEVLQRNFNFSAGFKTTTK